MRSRTCSASLEESMFRLVVSVNRDAFPVTLASIAIKITRTTVVTSNSINVKPHSRELWQAVRIEEIQFRLIAAIVCTMVA
jgi:hypothetical protein